MMKHCLVVACLAGAFALAGAAPSRAQSAGSVLGGLAGGVIGGMIAGSIAAQAARQRPVVVYAPRRRTRVVRYARPRPAYPAAGPARVQAVNASGDPFASPRSGVTVVNQAR